MQIQSKLPEVGTTIFTVMSALANEYGAINLSQGFPNFDCPEPLKAMVEKYLQGGKNQYVPMAGVPELRERLAEKIQRGYDRRINSQTEITITAGATQALFTAIATFIRPDDEVILIEPAYDSYRPSIEVMGAKAIPYELVAPDYQIDWDALGALVNNRTRMIIINTPQNPIGRTLKADDLRALETLTKGTDILVLSDEVYEHLIYDGAEHQSILRYPELFERSLAVYSFGKTFHSTGWKVGYCVAPEHLMAEFRKVHQFNVFSVNSFVQYGIAEYLSDPSTYATLSEFYQKKRDFFQAAMKGSRLQPLPSEGTYFQLYDYSAVSDKADTEFVKRLTIEHGVAAIPVSAFYSSGRQDGMIRFCFAKTEDVLERAAERLRKV
jgi:methionine aminotransferase